MNACVQTTPNETPVYMGISKSALSTFTFLLKCFEVQQQQDAATTIESWFFLEDAMEKSANSDCDNFMSHGVFDALSPLDKMYGAQWLVSMCVSSSRNKLLLCRLYWHMASSVWDANDSDSRKPSIPNLLEVYYKTFYEDSSRAAPGPSFAETRSTETTTPDLTSICGLRTPTSESGAGFHLNQDLEFDRRPEVNDMVARQSKASKDMLMTVLRLTNKVMMPQFVKLYRVRSVHAELWRQHRFLTCLRESISGLRRKRANSRDRVGAALSLVREQQAIIDNMVENDMKNLPQLDRRSKNFQELFELEMQKDTAAHPDDELFPLTFPMITKQTTTKSEFMSNIALAEVSFCSLFFSSILKKWFKR